MSSVDNQYFFSSERHRESYMSAHFLLSLFNELNKSHKMQGLQSFLFLFRNKFDKFNNTGAHKLDSIFYFYHMTLKLHVLKITFLA